MSEATVQPDDFDFDHIIDRHGSNCVKVDALEERFGRPDLTALWVADMDFATPSFIRTAVARQMEQPVWGYTMEHPQWRRAICDWQRRRHQWEVDPESITFIPGIVKGIGAAVEFLTDPCDCVVIQPPVYHPFRIVPEGLGRRVIDNPLTTGSDGRFAIDLDHLDRVTADPSARMLILSNPHNPGGQVWSRDTLAAVAAICRRNGVVVISDEIHADMILSSHHHTPWATAGDDARAIGITFGSPSKAFNMPGLASSYCIVPDSGLRGRFYSRLTALEFNDAAMFQQAPVVAAYDQGESWLEAMLAYVYANMQFVCDFCRDHIPGIKPLMPDASFLMWLDCRGLGLTQSQLVDLMVNRARLALNDGEMFGQGGTGFMRLNVASPRSVIADALSRLAAAVKSSVSQHHEQI